MVALLNTPIAPADGASTGIVLRPYQQAAITAIKTATHAGVRRQLVQLPTGAGKTVVFADILRQRRGRGRALVLAHRDELILQAVEKLQAAMPGEPVGIVKAARRDIAAQTMVASVQSLSRPDRLGSVGGGWGTIIIDEAHHAAAATYQDILEALGGYQPHGPLVLGFTATPVRGDKLGLQPTFEQLVYQYPLPQMIAEGWLVPLRGLRVVVHFDGKRVRQQNGDYAASDLDRALTNANAPGAMLGAWQTHAAGRPTLVFTPTVALAQLVAVTFQRAGIAAAYVSATTPREERHALLSALRDGSLTVLANCGVLTEGFDEPSLQCIVIARPTKSLGLYLQMLGRGTRTAPGKTECLVLDVVGVSGRHANQLGDAWVLGANAEPTTLSSEAEEREQPAAVVSALKLAEDHDLEPVPPQALRAWNVSLLGRGATAQLLEGRTPGIHGAWLRHDGPQGERWLLPAGHSGPSGRDAVYLVRPDPTLRAMGMPLWRGMRLAGAIVEWHYEGDELPAMLSAAETHAASLAETPLIQRRQAWRQAPATDRQLAALRYRNVGTTAITTKGEAQLAFALHAVRRWL